MRASHDLGLLYCHCCQLVTDVYIKQHGAHVVTCLCYTAIPLYYYYYCCCYLCICGVLGLLVGCLGKVRMDTEGYFT